jgi:hypothetical protein
MERNISSLTTRNASASATKEEEEVFGKTFDRLVAVSHELGIRTNECLADSPNEFCQQSLLNFKNNI